MRGLRLCLALMLLVLGVGTWAQSSERFIRPGDRVLLTVEEEPSLNREYTITRNGLILVNFLGAVEVAGLGESAAATRISEALVARKVLSKATVTLKLQGVTQRPITYSGAVDHPGEMPYREGIRLADVLTVAKPTDSADLSRVEIEAATGEKLRVNLEVGVDERPNPELRAGDRVFFPVLLQPRQVLVLGGVKRPGAINFTPGMRLLDALREAGGMGPMGDSKKVRLEREGAESRTYDVSIEEPDNPELKTGDRVVVELLPTRRFVGMEGEVRNPGAVEFFDGLKLTQAIDSVGGLTGLADPKKVLIIRTEGREKKTLTVDYERIIRGFVGDVLLRPDDVIRVERRRR